MPISLPRTDFFSTKSTQTAPFTPGPLMCQPHLSAAHHLSNDDNEEQYHTACEGAMIYLRMKPHLQELYPYLRGLELVDTWSHRLRCTAMDSEPGKRCKKPIGRNKGYLGVIDILGSRLCTSIGNKSEAEKCLKGACGALLCEQHEQDDGCKRKLYDSLAHVLRWEFPQQAVEEIELETD